MKNKIRSIICGNKTHWFQVRYKDSFYMHSNIIQGQNTTKNKYFKIQLCAT